MNEDSMNNEQLQFKIQEVFSMGAHTDAKVNCIMRLFNQFQPDGVIVGWIEHRVKRAEMNTYVDVRMQDGTVRHERLVTPELELEMRQKDCMYRPSFI